ncbi:hypothetical protein [Microbacterium binotii]|uniref:Lipoprotein n=1 Tax=Microbacterium binotii TaxID=462710 RepID=A0ABP6BPD0_9MICO
MYRRLAVLPLLAVLALAGCASGSARTSAEACLNVMNSWQEYASFAETPGRADGAVAEGRAAVRDAVSRASIGAPEWMLAQMKEADKALDAVTAAPSSPDGEAAFQAASDAFETIRDQCKADRNL